jgi:hypothetical protein
MDENDLPELKTAEEVAGYLALKHANGMPFKQVLDLHTLILTRIGRDYSRSWGWRQDQECPDDVRKYFHHLRDGAYFVLEHLEEDDDWYIQDEDDSETSE